MLRCYRPLHDASKRFTCTQNFNAIREISPKISVKNVRPSTSFAGTETGNAYPERILVYHAGLGKIVTVSSIKLTTVFFSILGCFFATNVIINMPDQPVWQGPAIFAGGAVPLLTVGFLTSPFVAMVHMRIPPSVRPRSRALVARWAESLPRSTELHFTTVGLIGMRHTYRSLYAPLRRKEPAPFWNISNLVVTGVARGSATGWVPRIRRQQGQFFVGIQYQRGSEAQIWKQAWGKIPWL